MVNGQSNILMVSRDPYKQPTTITTSTSSVPQKGPSHSALGRKRTQSNHRISSAKVQNALTGGGMGNSASSTGNGSSAGTATTGSSFYNRSHQQNVSLAQQIKATQGLISGGGVGRSLASHLLTHAGPDLIKSQTFKVANSSAGGSTFNKISHQQNSGGGISGYSNQGYMIYHMH
jgi:hypothetical protein